MSLAGLFVLAADVFDLEKPGKENARPETCARKAAS